jgi:predicted ATPase
MATVSVAPALGVVGLARAAVDGAILLCVSRRTSTSSVKPAFLRSLYVERERVPSFERYPFSIPAVAMLTEPLELDPKVTFFVGENGSGKSTLIEAIAVACKFNAEGGTVNFNFSTRRSESELHDYIRVSRGARRNSTGFFLRAESMYNVATQADQLGVGDYGGVSLHEQSHGESFIALVMNRFWPNGLYILDEPEAALSPQRQLSLLTIVHRLVQDEGCQFLIATHSPILMAYPGALIYQLGAEGIAKVEYEDTEHFTVTRDFLNNRERYFQHLLGR